jgi:hypothetical protein
VALVATAHTGLGVTSARAGTAGVDQRTRTIAYLGNKCGRAAALALQAAVRRESARAPKLVSLAQAECDSGQSRLLKVASGDLEFVPEDALVAFDDWRRGLRTLSAYVPNGNTSALAKARRSIGNGTTWWTRVMEEIDQVRLRHGFARL